VLILEHAVEHKNLLTAARSVGLKRRARRPAQQGHVFGAEGV
jgi:hypothetical protein